MRKIWAVFAISLAVPAFAADKDPLLDRMAGKWVLVGTIENQQTTHDVTAAWVLQNTYLRLTEVSREKDASGKPLYEAEVLLGYDDSKKRYVCFWYDVTGVAAPEDGGGIAIRQGDTLPFLFKYSGSAFHTTFIWQETSGAWQLMMDGEDKAGKRVPFARMTLTKAP